MLGLGIAFWYLNGNTLGGRVRTLAPVVQAATVAVALELDRRADRTLWTGLLAALALASGLWTVLADRSSETASQAPGPRPIE